MKIGVAEYAADPGMRLKLTLSDGTILRGSRIKITHTWRAPSGVLVQSCVPRSECSRVRAFFVNIAYYARYVRYV